MNNKTKVIQICAKCSDLFSANLVEVEQNETGSKVTHNLGSYDGYVPDFFPDEHYGDYVILHIDINTGKIINWKKPSVKDLTIFK